MRDYKRTDRVGDLIRAEIADILMKKIKDPRIGFVTLTEVDVSPDLRHAKVFFSELTAQPPTMEGLTSAVGFIRSELKKRLYLRYIPDLVFCRDDSIERGARMATLLDELKRTDEPAASH